MNASDRPQMQPDDEASFDEVLDEALKESGVIPPGQAAPDPPPTQEAEGTAGSTEEDAAPEEVPAEAPASPEAGEPDGRDAEIERLTGELAGFRDRYLRAVAELENVRKRSRRELETSTNLARANLLRELLEVADNFGRALEAAPQGEEAPETGFGEGVRLIYVQFMDILRQNGCERIPAKGEPFDPNLHEAISQIETDEVPSQHVFAVVQEGYRLNDHVLRPAKVVVAN